MGKTEKANEFFLLNMVEFCFSQPSPVATLPNQEVKRNSSPTPTFFVSSTLKPHITHFQCLTVLLYGCNSVKWCESVCRWVLVWHPRDTPKYNQIFYENPNLKNVRKRL